MKLSVCVVTITTVFMFQACQCMPVKTNVQTCHDVLKFYQSVGHQVDDCIEDPASKSLIWRVDDPLPWEMARNVCRSVAGADLLVPKTGFQRMILTNLIMMKHTGLNWYHCWIGIEQQQGSYTYTDGSPVESYRWSTQYGCMNNQNCGFAFINWSKDGQNACYDSGCAGLYYCTNAPCSTITFPFICQVQYL